MSFPARTYLLNQKLLSLGGDLWIEDEAGNRAFAVQGKVMSLRRIHTLLDPNGSPLYQVGQSLAHVHRTFEIKRGEEVVATVQQALINLLGDHFTITLANGTALAVTGDFINREFHVTQAGTEVIFASRRLLAIRDSYGVQIAPGFDVALGLAIVVALEQMELEERQR
ncbi:MAG: LURP-one-related family protein [Candidatus Limnocylindrales bacterium]|jgi:uncharacterized protein YxjI